MEKGKETGAETGGKRSSKILMKVKANWQLYLFLLPAILYFAVFRYAPMGGLQMAFRNYNPVAGVLKSPWVGMDHFVRFFQSPDCFMVIGNTLKISLLNLILGFPVPILLALLLNQTRNQRFKKVVQTTIYAPHFISTVIIVGMLNLFLSPTSGIINKLIGFLGHEPVMFMGSAALFPAVYIISEIWQTMGYNSIVYIAALTGVSPELHESAIMDGATVMQRIRYIDLPSIMPTIVVLLIMNSGRILTIGYEKIYLMQNSLNRSGSEVISTYVYRQAFGAVGLPNFSYATAIGLFESVVSLVMLLIVNHIASKYSDTTLV